MKYRCCHCGCEEIDTKSVYVVRKQSRIGGVDKWALCPNCNKHNQVIAIYGVVSIARSSGGSLIDSNGDRIT